jgi:pimeloyl-ACP methyl ester carboxylesterase
MNDTVFASQSIAIGDGRVVSYLEAGRGEPVVLLHGVGSGARSWLNQLADLQNDLRLIAWDAPGYGESTCMTDPAPKPSEYAESLTAFVAALNLSRFHLVGHSLGALIATNYAMRHADRLLSLTLASIAPGHAHLPEEERLRLRRGRLDVLDRLGPRGMAESRGPNLLSPDATDAMRRAVIETMAAIRPDGYRQAVHMLSQGDTRSDLAQVSAQVPVQIVFGSKDTVTPPASNRRTAEARPQVPIQVIEGGGHAVYIEKPTAFNKILRDFVALHSSTGS